MAFVLEPISAADRHKMIADAAVDPAKQRDLEYAARHVHDFPKRWAVDREHNCYLSMAPVIVRQDTMGTALHVFFRERLYAIRIDTAFGHTVSVVDEPPPLLRGQFLAVVRSALAVFGRAGAGPTDFLGNEDAIYPQFRLRGPGSGYRLQWIRPGDPVEATEQYRQAVARHFGRGFGSRLVDDERDRALYCAAVNGNEDRPPGRYLLFLGADVVTVDAYEQPAQCADGTVAFTFRVHAWTLPAALEGDVTMVRAAVIEALEAEGYASEWHVAKVSVVFPAGL